MQQVYRIQSNDEILNRVQDNVAIVVNALTAVPLNSGIVLNDLVLASGDNTVYTTLPTALSGWFLTKKSANVDIYDKQSTNTNPKTLILNSSGAVTVSLFVF